jgi:ribosome-binding factor A
MSQRVAKVESVIRELVAPALMEILERDSTKLTVTRVDVAPDMHNATVWIGMLGNEAEQERLWKRVTWARIEIQDRLGKVMTMKYVPQLHFKRDTGGAYAEEIERLLKGLN